MRRGPVTLISLILAISGCAATEAPEGWEPARLPSVVVGVVTPPQAAGLPGRLLITDAQGGLITIRADGSEPSRLVEGDPATLRVEEAAWAPDGARVAWSQLAQTISGAAPRVVMSTPEGGDRVGVSLGVLPFYLAWDPTSTRLSYLGDGGSDIEMGVVQPDAPRGERIRPLDRGRPFYLAWGPDGRPPQVHLGAPPIGQLSLTGKAAPVDRSPGMFQAPAWSTDGDAALYVVGEGGVHQRIVLRHLTSGRRRALARADGAVSLTLSGDGSRVAYQALGPEELDIYDRDLPERATDVGVTVIDVVSGDRTRVTRNVALSWSWSPDGRRLAILEPVYSADGQIRFRWVVWDGVGISRTATFTGALPFLQGYAPFFSQYAQSSSLWAPDGSAFAYLAEDDAGVAWITIQPIGGGAYRLVPGSSVAWSPVA
jgi:hypothetical protein